MTYNELLQWWQSRYPAWASITAPLVRRILDATVSSVPLKTVLRLSFVRSRWRDESIRISNASSRLCNIYDCSAETILDDLSRAGILPLAEFIRSHPTQEKVSQATFSSPSAPQTIIQDVAEFDARLNDFLRANEADIQEAMAIVEATCPMIEIKGTPKLKPQQQDDLCFEWSHYLAIADSLEPERSKLAKFVKPDSTPPQVVANQCSLFFAKFQEILNHARQHKPPEVLHSWISDVETWMQQSSLAFPDYKSRNQARNSQKQKAASRFKQLLKEPDRKRLASIGEFTLTEDGEDGLTLTYSDLKEFVQGWSPMSLSIVIHRDAMDSGFSEADKSSILAALHQFTSAKQWLKKSAIAYARNRNFELSHNGRWIRAYDLTDAQLLSSVRKLKMEVHHPRTSDDPVQAILELDCDWDPEHGVCFGLMPNNEILLQPW